LVLPSSSLAVQDGRTVAKLAVRCRGSRTPRDRARRALVYRPTSSLAARDE